MCELCCWPLCQRTYNIHKMKSIKVRKAVIPVAGLGTRMLPASKAIPKEMFPIIDKPIIQHIVEEINFAGFEEIIFVTHSSKNSIQNHFDTSFELENSLEKKLKRPLLNELKEINNFNTKIISVRQGEALGLGHAILQSKNAVSGEPFAVILPDRVMNKFEINLRKDNLAFMKKHFDKFQSNIILIEKIEKKFSNMYGMVKEKILKQDSCNILLDILEKPSIENSPSNKAVLGRYIFKNNIFDSLEYVAARNKKSKKEIELTDAIKHYIKNSETIFTSLSKGECFDCGNKMGYLKAILYYAKNHKDTSKAFKKIISELS